MKKILLASILALVGCCESNAQTTIQTPPKTAAEMYITDYGNGIYYLDVWEARRISSIYAGQLLSQFKQLHKECQITAIGALSYSGFYVNCEVKNVLKQDEAN